MNKKGNLFFLIKSLNRSEKRYFSLFCSTLNVESNYLKLFEAIDQQESYDEKRLKEKLGDAAFTKQLHVTKIYLSQLILKCLRSYHYKISKIAVITDLIRDIELLYSKELFDQCYFTIQKAEQLAIEFEKLPLLQEILSWKRKLYLAKFGANPEKLLEVNNLEADTIAKVQSLHKYWTITSELARFNEPNSDPDGFSEKSIIDLAGPPKSTRAEVLYYHILYSQGIMGNNPGLAEDSLKKLVRLIEKHPKQIKDDPGSYINALNNQITYLILKRRYDEALPIIKKVRNIPDKFGIKKTHKLRLRTLLRTYNIELELYRDQKNLQKSKILIPIIVSFLEKYEKSVPDNYFILFWNQFATIEFMAREYAASLVWVNKIMQIKSNARMDIQRYSRLLHLVIHFELENVIFLRYSIESCRRFLHKTGTSSSFDKLCLKHFAKLSHLARSDYPKQLKRFHHDLFVKDPQLVTPGILDYLDIKQWLADRLGNSD